MNTDNAELLAAVEQELRACVPASHTLARPLYHMMGYHLGWLDQSFAPVQLQAGKRLRPLLCLLCCFAAGGEWTRALPAAAALELVHNFSLLHDDIEDNSTTRRGRATVWSVWGLAQGVNTGDAMLILARRSLNRLRQQKYGDNTLLEAGDILDRTLAQLCEGQYLDIAFERDLRITEDQYAHMISGKTAALLSASAQLGALLAHSPFHNTHYSAFGHNLGLAFQMVDDVLGIWGDPSVTGKSDASDIASRKMTLPIIYALHQEPVRAELTELYQSPALSRSDIERIVTLLDSVGAKGYVEQRASEYASQALAALRSATPLPAAVSRLHKFSESLVRRSM